MKPSQLHEKIKDRFELTTKYKFCANPTYSIQTEIFGGGSSDAENLKLLCEKIKEEFPEFFINVK